MPNKASRQRKDIEIDGALEQLLTLAFFLTDGIKTSLQFFTFWSLFLSFFQRATPTNVLHFYLKPFGYIWLNWL